MPGASSRRSPNVTTPATAVADVPPSSVPSPLPVARARVIVGVADVERFPSPSITSTETGGPAGSKSAALRRSPTRASCGWAAKRSAQAPVTVVVRASGADTSVKSLPGEPLNRFACLASTLQAYAPAAHPTFAVTTTCSAAPGASARSRSSITPPRTVAEPVLDPDSDAARSANADGAVRFAEPSGCWVERFWIVAVITDCWPAGTDAGVSATLYGL